MTTSVFQNPENPPIPIQSDSHYRLVIKPRHMFESTRRTTVDSDQGISYVYAQTQGLLGGSGEVVEIWFEKVKGWTASKVKAWAKKHSNGLPAPAARRAPTDAR